MRGRRLDLILNSWPALATWLALVVAAVYGRSLSLAFLADDFYQFPDIDRHNLLTMWQSVEELQYFRPLAFNVWALLPHNGGVREPAFYHALNLVLFWLAGLQVAWLAGHLWPASLDAPFADAWPRRYLAATLFLLFPFSYEAVMWVAAMMHPLTTVLILGSIIAYRQLTATGRLPWGVVSFTLACLAPFAHEIGALTFPLLILLEWSRPSTERGLGRRLAALSPWFGPPLLWWFVYRRVPVAQVGAFSEGFDITVAGLWRNVMYGAQATAYPFTWAGSRLADTVTGEPFAATAVLAALAFAVAITVQSRRPDRVALLPWLWTAVALAPALLFIPFRWLAASPRVLFLPAVGIALLWTDVIMDVAWLAGRRRGKRPAPAVVVILAAGLGLIGVTFIDKQADTYALGSDVVEAVAAAADDRPTILINFPFWLAPPKSGYALGEEGLLVLGKDSWLNGVVTIYRGGRGNLHAIRFDDIADDVPYHVGLTGDGPRWQEMTTEATIFVTRYFSESIRIEPAGVLVSRPTGGPPLATFDGAVSLLTAVIEERERQPWLATTWQVEAPLPADATLFVHLLDGGGQLVGQADGDPLAGTFPLGAWRIDQSVVDRRPLPSIVGPFRLLVGVYRRGDGARLPALAPDGAPFPDNAVPLTP